MVKAVLNNRLQHRNRLQVRAGERGVGLIEVLIALVVFALGVVGMAGLQLRTMSATMDSTQRSYVVAKSQDIADRIRSNGISPMLYLATYNAAGDFCQTADSATVPNCADTANGNTTGCVEADMVAFDLYDAFCVSSREDGYASDGSYDKQVAEWQVVIGCESPDPTTGVMAPSTSCDEVGARVFIDTSWFARTVDDDLSANPKRDSMIVRFVP